MMLPRIITPTLCLVHSFYHPRYRQFPRACPPKEAAPYLQWKTVAMKALIPYNQQMKVER